MNTPESLSILIVSYNCAELLTGCLDSIAANPPSFPYEIVLVDNGSSDGTPAMVAERYPHVRLVPNTENLGFARGNDLAASHASGDVLLLLNPDTVVLPGALDALASALLAEPDRAAAGGCLLNADGTPGTSWGDFPTLGWALSVTAPLNRLGIRRSTRSRMGMSCAEVTGATEVGWVSGAAFMVWRDVWERFGGLDTGYFMYFEETDLCHRIRESGGKVVVVPDARIVHLEGGAVGQASRRQRVQFTASMLRYFRRAEGTLPAAVLRIWVLKVNGLLWLASWPVGLASTHAREARSRYAALVRAALAPDRVAAGVAS